MEFFIRIVCLLKAVLFVCLAKIKRVWNKIALLLVLADGKVTDENVRANSANAAPEPFKSRRRSSIDDYEYQSLSYMEAEEETGTAWEQCTKNPGHKHFIPLPDFNLKHLPKRFQSKKCFPYIKCWAALTVRLRIKLSPDRPKDDPLAHQGSCSTGTASVYLVELQGTLRQFGQPKVDCMCKECETERMPRQNWAAIHLITANHCIYDDFEAENAKADFFYDSKESLRNGKMVTLHGGKRLACEQSNDYCMIWFPTHNLKLANFLFNMKNNFMDNIMFPAISSSPALEKEAIVIISHPHGRPKKVTIGELENYRPKEDIEDEEIARGNGKMGMIDLIFYDYTTSTCKGSSGAHIICLDDIATNNCNEYLAMSVHQKRGQANDVNIGLFLKKDSYLGENRYRASQRPSLYELSKAYKNKLRSTD